MAQDSYLFNDTILANLTLWGTDQGADEMFAALVAAGLEAFVRDLPKGLDTVVGERGVRLSGGERQRLALARALIRKPHLLVLDEATSALDYESEALIRDVLRRLKGEMTVVVITHRLYLAQDAHRIHVVEGGGLVESGSWDELTAPGRRFATLLASGEIRP